MVYLFFTLVPKEVSDDNCSVRINRGGYIQKKDFESFFAWNICGIVDDFLKQFAFAKNYFYDRLVTLVMAILPKKGRERIFSEFHVKMQAGWLGSIMLLFA